MGLALFTGNAALLPYAAYAKKAMIRTVICALVMVYIGNLIGNLIGSVIYAAIFSAINTHFFTTSPNALSTKLIDIVNKKTLASA